MPKNALNDSPEIIEGIGEKHGKNLEEGGIKCIADLASSSIEHLQILFPDYTEHILSKWMSAANFLLIKGITPNIAEVLVDSKIYSIEDLAFTSLRDLEAFFLDAKEKGKIPNIPDLYEISELSQRAGKFLGKGHVFGKILNKVGDVGIKDVLVSSSGKKIKTDEDGAFELFGISAGETMLKVQVNDNLTTFPVKVSPGKLSGPVVIKTDTDVPSILKNEMDERQGVLLGLSRGKRLTIKNIEMEELTDGSYFQIRFYLADGTVRLLNLFKRSRGNVVEAERIYLEKEHLPEGCDLGDIVYYKEGKFFKSKQSFRQILREKLLLSVGKNKLRLRRRYIPQKIDVGGN